MGIPFTGEREDNVLAGSVVGGRYVVREVLGQGLVGTVFGVEHAHFGRRAALKILDPRVSPPEIVQRTFHGETFRIWSVCHPCLADVIEVGTLPDGTPFFVTERLEGETLAARVRRDWLSLGAAVDVMMQLLSVFDAIHSRELVVRDLRPQNLFLANRRGCRPLLKLLDAGLGRLVTVERIRAQWGAVQAVPSAEEPALLAYPHYLSPERLAGEHAVTAQSDLFTATILFFEMLTGRRPFQAPTLDALFGQIVRATPRSIIDLRPDVPTEVAALVLRGLAPNPLARPRSAREYQDELRAAFESPKRASHGYVPAAPVVPMVEIPPAPPIYEPRFNPSVATQPPPDEDDPYALDDDETTAENRPTNEPNVFVDEASAESELRTIPPPGARSWPKVLPRVTDEIQIDVVDEDPATARDELALPTNAPFPPLTEEEETQTMELTPELRARIARLSQPLPVTTLPTTPADVIILPPSRPKPR